MLKTHICNILKHIYAICLYTVGNKRILNQSCVLCYVHYFSRLLFHISWAVEKLYLSNWKGALGSMTFPSSPGNLGETHMWLEKNAEMQKMLAQERGHMRGFCKVSSELLVISRKSHGILGYHSFQKHQHLHPSASICIHLHLHIPGTWMYSISIQFGFVWT